MFSLKSCWHPLVTNDGTEKIVERTEIEMETSNTFKIYEHPGLFALDFIGGKKSISTPHLWGWTT